MLYGQGYNQMQQGQLQQQGTVVGLNAVTQVLNTLDQQQIGHICNTMGIQNPNMIQSTLLRVQPNDQAYILGLLGTMYDTNMARQQSANMNTRPAVQQPPMYQGNQVNNNSNSLYNQNNSYGQNNTNPPMNLPNGSKSNGTPPLPQVHKAQPNNLFNPPQKETVKQVVLTPYRGSEYEPLVGKGKEVVKVDDGRCYEYKIKGECTMNKLGASNMMIVDSGVTNDDTANGVEGNEANETAVIISGDHFGLNKSINRTFVGNYLRLLSREKNMSLVAVDTLTLNTVIERSDFDIKIWYDILESTSNLSEVANVVNKRMRNSEMVLSYFGAGLNEMLTRKINERLKYDIVAGMQIESFLDDMPELIEQLEGELGNTDNGVRIFGILSKVFKSLKFDMAVAKDSEESINEELTVMRANKEVAIPEYITTIYIATPIIKSSLEAAYDKVEGIKTFQVTQESHPLFHDALEYVRSKTRFNHGSSAAVITDEENYRVFYSDYGYYTITKF